MIYNHQQGFLFWLLLLEKKLLASHWTSKADANADGAKAMRSKRSWRTGPQGPGPGSPKAAKSGILLCKRQKGILLQECSSAKDNSQSGTIWASPGAHVDHFSLDCLYRDSNSFKKYLRRCIACKVLVSGTGPKPGQKKQQQTPMWVCCPLFGSEIWLTPSLQAPRD